MAGDLAMYRAYAVLRVKSSDEERREIAGIATTPEPDRMGDIIEPLGVAYKNPLPLLLHHDKTLPIGTAKFKKPTKDGIEFTATLAQVAEPGSLRDRLDEAWQSIKAGLITGVSIGFRAIEMSFMKDGGIHFLKTEVLELSAVTVPANVDATILSIKHLDSLRVGSSRHGSAIKSAP